MKAILEFDLPKYQRKHFMAIRGEEFYNALWEFYIQLKQVRKYQTEDMSDKEKDRIEDIYEMFEDVLDDFDVNFDYLNNMLDREYE
jgi:hypothetical protein